MDPERDNRLQLIAHLGGEFLCFEEVSLAPPMLPQLRLRADVVGIPRTGPLAGLPLAFEVKCPTSDRRNHYAEWAPAIKQAADYVYAKIEDEKVNEYNGRRILSAFVFPAPALLIEPQGKTDRETHMRMISSGAFHAALYFRVGRAWMESKSSQSVLALSMGPNPIWSQGAGWHNNATQLVNGKQKFGSRMIDVLIELNRHSSSG